MEKLDKLSKQLGYPFCDKRLLQIALTHRSTGLENNERLEFLGDALLNLFIAEKLFHSYPKATEGELSRLRASLVNGETLAQLAKELAISEYLRLGSGEQRSGGSERKSILANVMEAIIGAIYLDGDISHCQQRVLEWFASRIESISSKGVQKDPKTQLQEYLQARKLPLPVYKVLTIAGHAHTQIFHVQCRVARLGREAVGLGTSRRRAEQDAAQKFLELL